MPFSTLQQWCSDHDIEFSDEQLALFQAFQDELYQQNQVKNLTRVPVEECEVRHFLDSVLALNMIPENSSVLDIGTGPGFPSWPIACLRPDLLVEGFDGSPKGFSVSNAVPLDNLRMVQGRAEDRQDREEWDVVVGRALAPLAIQLEISAPWAKVGGLVIPFRTVQDREAAEDFPAKQLGLELKELIEAEIPDGAVRLFPIYRKKTETPREFPRPWARIKQRPLRKPDPPRPAQSTEAP